MHPASASMTSWRQALCRPPCSPFLSSGDDRIQRTPCSAPITMLPQPLTAPSLMISLRCALPCLQYGNTYGTLSQPMRWVASRDPALHKVPCVPCAISLRYSCECLGFGSTVDSHFDICFHFGLGTVSACGACALVALIYKKGNIVDPATHMPFCHRQAITWNVHRCLNKRLSDWAQWDDLQSSTS